MMPVHQQRTHADQQLGPRRQCVRWVDTGRVVRYHDPLAVSVPHRDRGHRGRFGELRPQVQDTHAMVGEIGTGQFSQRMAR